MRKLGETGPENASGDAAAEEARPATGVSAASSAAEAAATPSRTTASSPRTARTRPAGIPTSPSHERLLDEAGPEPAGLDDLV